MKIRKASLLTIVLIACPAAWSEAGNVRPESDSRAASPSQQHAETLEPNRDISKLEEASSESVVEVEGAAENGVQQGFGKTDTAIFFWGACSANTLHCSSDVECESFCEIECGAFFTGACVDCYCNCYREHPE